MIHSYCKHIAMLSRHILFKGDGKEEILAALNLAVVFFFFAYLHGPDLKDGKQSVLSEGSF